MADNNQNNQTITADKIRKMSSEEWQEFRQKSWIKKREYYNQDMPAWYLKDQEWFASYLDKRQNRRR
jgi:hypothetical protein